MTYQRSPVLVLLLLAVVAARRGGKWGWDRRCLDDSCTQKWSKILETNAAGNVIAGSKSELQYAVRSGVRIKFGTSTQVAETDNCKIIKGEVCCQVLKHMSYAQWEKFQNALYWWMINPCTTGNWHMIRYYVGGNYLSETRSTSNFLWYAERNKDGSYASPLYSTDSDGSVTSGSLPALLRAVDDGKPVSIVQGGDMVLPIQVVSISSTSRSVTVSAQHLWMVDQTDAGGYLKFVSDNYWMFNLLTSTGSRNISRWTLGSHTSRGVTQDNVAMDWYADDCWQEVRSGCDLVDSLTSLVEAGHAIRVKVGSRVLEAENIRLTSDAVSVQIVSQLSMTTGLPLNDLNWEFQIITTKGNKVKTYRPLVGSSAPANLSTTEETMDVSWFVDTKRWTLLYHQAIDGTDIAGSPLSVRQAAEARLDIRVGFKLVGDSGYRFSRPENLNFGPSPYLSAQLVRLLRDQPVNGQEFELDKTPQWSFTLVNNKGFVRSSLWTVGEHVNMGRGTERAAVMWFASL